MRSSSNKLVVTSLFRDIVQSPLLDMFYVERYFAPSYTQTVDGVVLDYAGFVDHLRRLKERICFAFVSLQAIAEEGDTVFTNHVITVTTRDGTVTRTQVIAQFTVRESRLCACQELTRLIS